MVGPLIAPYGAGHGGRTWARVRQLGIRPLVAEPRYAPRGRCLSRTRDRTMGTGQDNPITPENVPPPECEQQYYLAQEAPVMTAGVN